MSRYANIVNGFIIEVFDTPDNRPISEFFHEEMLWVEIEGFPNAQPNWVAKENKGVWSFSEYVEPLLSEEETFKVNNQTMEALKTYAATAMTPILLSIQLGNSTEDDIDLAKKWQEYHRKLSLVDLTSTTPEWPII